MTAPKIAIILAAGLGSRLKPLTDKVPKCLVKVRGKTILLNTLDSLANLGIQETVIVIGYLAKKIQEVGGDFHRGMKITYVENTLYDKTNNMYSLWLARAFLERGVLLIEGDSFFETEVLVRLLAAGEGSFWATDKFSLYNEGCMLTSDDKGEIRKIEIVRGSKAMEGNYNSNNHKSADVINITPQLGRQFSQWLEQEVQEGNVNIYYDMVLSKYLEPGMIFTCNINGLKWMEIDDYEDLRRAEGIFNDSSSGFERKSEIVSIGRLRPLEKVFPNHLKNLHHLLLKDRVIKAPLLADRKTGIVLDGSHRYIFFLMNGYHSVPVHFVDYENENIRVGTNLLHRHLINNPTNISKAEVIQRGLSGNLFLPRTTRHFFPFRKIDDLNMPLTELTKGEPREVSEFIEDVTIKNEIIHNEEFVKEIEEEVDELIMYLYEIRKVKDYLNFQIEKMKEQNPQSK